MKNIDIKYYGTFNKEVLNTKTWGLSEVPGRDATEYEVYKDLKEFLISTDLKDKINIEYIDIKNEEIPSDDPIREILEKYETPILSIDDKEYIVGKEHNVNVYIKIKNHLK